MELTTTNDFKKIVLNQTPLIDVRAPIEYEKGTFPGAVNIPLMDDEQRHLIGIRYKEAGNEKAVELGHELVSGTDKESKIAAWTSFIEDHPETIIFCFRGGQRSRISQEWIQEALGREVQRIEGGYKAFRHYLLDELNPKHQNFQPIRLGGHTGSGKTILLGKLDFSVDLEGIANHRGSSFGNQITPQPSQINFENQLAYKLIQLQDQGYTHLVFEDEGKNIGRCFVPKDFSLYYRQSPLVVIKVPVEERARIILQEYVIDSQKAHRDYYGDHDGLNLWLDYIIGSINKAKRRLGGDRHVNMLHMVKEAFTKQIADQNPDHHLPWIHDFLVNYYDPMYEYQLSNNQEHVVFQGSTDEVYDYLTSLSRKQ